MRRAPRDSGELIGRGDGPSGRLQQPAPGRGELDTAPVAEEQLRADVALQPADLLAERGLGDEQARRRPPEVQLVGDREVVVPGAGHASNQDNPEAFTAALSEFLGRVLPRRRARWAA